MMDPDDVKSFVEGLNAIAFQLKNLGVGNAMTQMGAIEMLAMEVKDGTTRIAESLDRVADALVGIGDAIEQSHGDSE